MAAVVTGAVVLAFCIPLALYVRTVAYDRAVDGADVEARSLAAELFNVRDLPTIERLTRLANSAAPSTPATVYLADGRALRVLGGSLVAVPADVRDGHNATIARRGSPSQVWEPVRGKSASVAVMVSVPPRLLTQGVDREWFLIFGGGVLLILIAIALADWMGRTIVRPIADLEEVTHELSKGDMQRRVEPAGPYEVAEVGRAVNELADRIDSLLASARIAGADLGHRLRTPLAALRLDVETVADPRTRSSLAKDLESLESAVNRLIRDTREPPKPRGHADLAGAVRHRMDFWAVLAKSQGRRYGVDVPSRRIEVPLDRDDLEAAIDALLSNIFTHTPEGTGFRVRLRQSQQDSRNWTLVVEDDGSASPPGPSASSSRGGKGTGLGLDIVGRTAERAGGTAQIGRSRTGGFRVELVLPEATTDEVDQRFIPSDQSA